METIKRRQRRTFISRERPIIERLHDCVAYEPNTGCWLWLGCITKYYGSIRYNRKRFQAHRLMYELTVAKIPEGMLLCHKCDVPICVNPDHMFVGTQKDNVADMLKKGRKPKTHASVALKLTKIQVLLIRESTEPNGVVAKRYNISRSTVWDIKNYRRWKNLKTL